MLYRHLTGDPSMSTRLGFALFPLLLLGIPAFAEPTCVECLTATQEELRRCLNNAISEEDKLECDLNAGWKERRARKNLTPPYRKNRVRGRARSRDISPWPPPWRMAGNGTTDVEMDGHLSHSLCHGRWSRLARKASVKRAFVSGEGADGSAVRFALSEPRKVRRIRLN